jgi:hypothetical protein
MKKKIDLTDVTLILIVRVDSKSRLENVETVIEYISKYISINVLVCESDSIQHVFPRNLLPDQYSYIEDFNPYFWRTKINNLMIGKCTTPYAMLYDADVIVSPSQLLSSVKFLRENKYKFMFPYDGRFLMVDPVNKLLFRRLLDIKFLDSWEKNFEIGSQLSVGGCIIFEIEAYSICGLENEKIIGWGHDDCERVKRIEKCGFLIGRISGPLYHLHHDRLKNSHFFDENLARLSYFEYFSSASNITY